MRQVTMGNGAALAVHMCAVAGPALVLEIPGERDVLDVAVFFADAGTTGTITDGETVHRGYTRLYGVTKTGLAAEDPILVTLTRGDEAHGEI